MALPSATATAIINVTELSSVSFDLVETDSVLTWSHERLWPQEKKITYYFISIAMTVVGIIGNALVIAAPYFHRVLLTPGNVFIINLAIADMVVSMFLNPSQIIALYYGPEWFTTKPVLCNILGDLCLLSCGASLITILFIAVNRYIAIVHHQHYSRIYTWRNSILIAVTGWVLSAFLTFPSTHSGYFTENVFEPTNLICTADLHKSKVFNIVWLTVFFVTPLAIIGLLYLKLFRYVWKAKKALTHNAEGEGGASRGMQVAEIKLAKTLFISYLMFVICWTPRLIGVLVDFHATWSPWFWMFEVAMAHGSSSGVNAIIYGITNTNFKRGYVKVIRQTVGKCCWCWEMENQVNTHQHSNATGKTPAASANADVVEAS